MVDGCGSISGGDVVIMIAPRQILKLASDPREASFNICQLCEPTSPHLHPRQPGDNGRTFPFSSQTTAEGQEDEQWQRSLLSRPIDIWTIQHEYQSSSISSRSFPLASTKLGFTMGDSAIDIDGSRSI